MAYSVSFDAERRLVVADLDGFWTPEIVARYSDEVLALMRKVRLHHPHFGMLARSVGMSVQSVEVSIAFGAFTAKLVQLCSGRIAITVGSTLNKIQAERALAHDRIGVFLSDEEAFAWLAG